MESLDFQGENNCATVERLNRRLRDRVKEINSFYKKPRQTPRAVIEPASKYHLILLPEYIQPTDNDIAILKIDALKAERAGNWALAEALWTRLIRFDQEEALSSLKQIWKQSQNQGTARKVKPETVSNKSGEKAVNDDSSGLSTFEFAVVTVNDQGKEIKREKREAEYYAEDLGNGVTLDMVAISGGSFWMGTEDEEIERLCKTYDSDWFKNESPQHKVNVANFFMGRYPITQAQWREVAGWEQVERKLDLDPSYFKKDYEGIDRWIRPVESIFWEDAKEFCARLSKKTNKEYRLPIEAEWEYACRARTTTPFNFGETISTDLANYRGTDWKYKGKVYPGNYGKGSKGIFREQTTPVGYLKVANNFGLCDMHGQVWEWCEDDWHDNYEDAPIDGKVWLTGASGIKVVRGGSWALGPDLSRSAYRADLTRGFRGSSGGFRVVCVAPRTT